MRVSTAPWACLAMLTMSAAVHAQDYRNDIGYDDLVDRVWQLGSTGAGVTVMQIEAPTGTDSANLPIWSPVAGCDEQSVQRVTSRFRDQQQRSLVEHIESRDQRRPAVLWHTTRSPLASAGEVGNAGRLVGRQISSASARQPRLQSRTHASSTIAGSARSMARRSMRKPCVVPTGWSSRIVINVAAVNNGAANRPLLGSAFNSIAVGVTSGNHPRGSFDLSTADAVYAAGRTRPDVVAPIGSTSGAAPVVSSLAAVLVETGHTGGATLSHGSTTNRAGATIYNAERAETIKAAIMAGADRETHNLSTSAQINDYRASGYATANGLDSRYGAGQVNVSNSHQIIAAGEHEAGSVLRGASVQSAPVSISVENSAASTAPPPNSITTSRRPAITIN